jgi:hypothetical protein
MPIIAPSPSRQRDPPETSRTGTLAVTDGEIHFLWWFIQGSIMTPETRAALLRGFGFCERHAWVHLSVEMSFRKQHFLGPVILYRELIEKSVQATKGRRQLAFQSPLRQLKAAGPCFLCTLDIKPAATGATPPARLARGRDSNGLRLFATNLTTLWRPTVCAICSGNTCETRGSPRCRPHLLADLTEREPIDLSWHQDTLNELSVRLARYERSFVAGADKPSEQERAALISAVGWCSGWRPLLALLGRSTWQ